nr:RNA-directed DNA polymerase, eukaryota [Tanacetum cinerariifolium]
MLRVAVFLTQMTFKKGLHVADDQSLLLLEHEEVSRRGYKKGSKHDDVTRISTSVFVTNFPTSFTAKELYLTCKQYGHVVDSFIPVKKTKDGTVSKGDSGNSPAIVLDDDCVAAYADFFSRERIVWVDVEGISLNAWSSNTFSRIGNKLGEVMDIEESTGSLFSRKRLCIKTCLPINILESFKVIFKGKIFMVCAKELFTWSPCFSDFKVDDYSSDEEPQVGDLRKPVMPMDDMEKVVNDSDEEVVSESFFETGPDLNCINNEGDGIIQDEVHNSVDPFGIYDILNKNTVKNVVPDPSLSHPLGFTPVQSSSDSPLVERTRVAPKISNTSSVLKELVRVLNEDSLSQCASTKILIVVIYAPQAYTCKRTLWEYISSLINRWEGESIVLGDFNVVRTKDERFGSVFNPTCARNFNQFISSSGLINVKMDGYSFMWSLPSASKMSKLDRFLVSNGILSMFPSISSVCLDRHLSDHRPIILKESSVDYGPTPFRIYHSWFSYEGFDALVSQAWKSFDYNDSNKLICFKKKLQDVKKIIRPWINNQISLKKGSNLLY